MMDRLNALNTTNFRIVVSIGLAAIGVVAVLYGILFQNWLPTAEQIKVLEGVAIVVLTMMGFDVIQFVGKRFSDATYAAAKNPSPVNVEAPSTVTVAPPAPESDVAVEMPHTHVPETP